MKEVNKLHQDATEILKATSRTFFIPISYLAPGAKEAVSSAYLCMRAIDEIEDHPALDSELKSELLHAVSRILQTSSIDQPLEELFAPHKDQLPEVTVRLADWIKVCPASIRKCVVEATAEMAQGMGDWVEKNWHIEDEQDLDDYTYCVAGAVGVMLSDIWKWHDGTETDKQLAIAYGRGLQSVNILRNYKEDQAERGVSFFPSGWGLEEMFSYARRNLAMGDQYLEDIPENTTVRSFCKIPLALAHSTLDALVAGKEKMSRAEVTEVVSRTVEE